jgi:hypothetical protein
MRPIAFGDGGREATRELIARFDSEAPGWRALDATGRVEALRRRLAALEAIDRQYGSHAPITLENADELVDAILSDLAHFPAGAIVLGIALWAIRHQVSLRVVEPVVNALAEESNRAQSKQDLAAAFGLMQGVIAHVRPQLAPDLERSNPERPWRLLHVNLAITAIRTEDPDMIEFAFDALEAALPDERAGFFAEALALALAPGIGDDVRNRIERRHLKWTADR